MFAPTKASFSMDRISRALRIAKLAHSLGEYDTNVLGIVGEVIAEERFGMRKASKQSKDSDGHVLVDGVARSLQVKTLSSSRIAAYRGGAKFRVAHGVHPEYLLVLLVFPLFCTYEVLFYGPASSVGRAESVNGVARRGVCVHHLFVGREDELLSILNECIAKSQAPLNFARSASRFSLND